MMRAAIVGAGIAGLACADALRAAGTRVTLFDKARGIGGRMAARRAATPRGEIAFDHGATHFTVRSADFRARVDRWEAAGCAAPWPDAGQDAWIGVPTMNAPLKHMAGGHDVRLGAAITALSRIDGQWFLHREKERSGPFDIAVVAIPGEQAAPLLSLHDFGMARAAMAAHSRAIWSAMFAFHQPLGAPSAFLRGSAPIVCAVRGNARPQRTATEHWVVQADWNWSEAHLADDPAVVCDLLRSELGALIGQPVPEPCFAAAQRWMLGQPSGSELGHLWNDALGLGACGDWLSHGFVEHAWRSGHDLGAAIVAARALAGVER